MAAFFMRRILYALILYSSTEKPRRQAKWRVALQCKLRWSLQTNADMKG
jgi:hypothetical protein